MTSAASPAAASGVETRLSTRDGAMLFDATLPNVAGDDWFEPGRWPSSASAAQVAGGRGGVVFLRDGDAVYRTYYTGARGVEYLGSHWSYLDLTPFGRQESWEESPPGRPQSEPYAWLRRHDEYAG